MNNNEKYSIIDDKYIIFTDDNSKKENVVYKENIDDKIYELFDSVDIEIK